MDIISTFKNEINNLENQINNDNTKRTVYAVGRVAALTASVAFAALATLTIPFMIAGTAVGPFIGFAAASGVTYFAYKTIKANDRSVIVEATNQMLDPIKKKVSSFFS